MRHDKGNAVIAAGVLAMLISVAAGVWLVAGSRDARDAVGGVFAFLAALQFALGVAGRMLDRPESGPGR